MLGLSRWTPRGVVLAVLPLLATVVACSGGGDLEPERPDLSGYWMLNEEESEDPEDRPNLSMPGRPAGFGGGMAAGMARGFSAFTIEQTDSTVSLRSIEGMNYEVHTDGRSVESQVGQGTSTLKARWKGERLVIDRTMGRGTKMTQSFELSEDGRQLYMKITIEMSRGGPVYFKRVYDAPASRG